MLKRLVGLGGVFAIVPCLAFAQSARWQVGTSPSVSTGHYGTSTRTEVLYTAFTIRRLFGHGDVNLIAPITCIRGDSGVTIVSGSPVRTSDPNPLSSTPPGRGQDTRDTRSAATNTPAGTASTAVSTTSACGPGDIIVRGRAYVVDEHGWIPTVALRAHVKVPTASADRGLGTGRFDQGAGVELTKALAPGLFLLADAGYTFIGQPADYALNNRWWYDIGIARRLTTTLDVSVYFEEYSALVPDLVNARNILGVVTVGRPIGWRLQIAADVGLSDGAPERGLTVGLSRRF